MEDCSDFSDESTCPKAFEWDDCGPDWGDSMCYWKEEPNDALDWIIAAGIIKLY